MPTKAGVYLHIPFCRSRCSYCDFATDVWRNADTVERYVRALTRDIQRTGSEREIAVDTIYLGGGTPSLLEPEQVSQIIDAVRNKFDVDPAAEITMEMNPATVSRGTLTGYRELGVNRASFGLQTFNDRDLKLLARGHNANDARETFKLLRETGFENISFDLIAGLPGQTLKDWERNLDEALSMQPEHLSLYLLEIHEGTPLAEQLRSGRRSIPDDTVAAEMYEVLLDRIADAGYTQYEISNFAKPGFESRHNTKYWRLEPVYGFGVSAHSFNGTERYWNGRDTADYVAKIEKTGSAEVGREKIDARSEFVFLGLRLNDGVGLEDFQARFGTDIRKAYSSEIDELADLGLVQLTPTDLRLTPRGMLFSNEVFTRFV